MDEVDNIFDNNGRLNNGHNLLVNDDDIIEAKMVINQYFKLVFKQKIDLTWTPRNELEINREETNSLTNRQNSIKKIKRKRICEHLIQLSNDLLQKFGENIDEMCEKLSNSLSSYDHSVTDFTLIGNQSFKSIANELFADGIKWAHILTLFVFTYDFSVYYYRKNLYHLIDEIVDWLISYVITNLLLWIVNHGGWVNRLSLNRSNLFSLKPHFFH